MLPKTSILIAASLLWMASNSLGQETGGAIEAVQQSGLTGVANLLQSVNLSEMVQLASDLRTASESLVQFGDSLKEIATITANAATSTSENLAAIGGEFDPFGFKTAFQTIQQQNAIIQAQNKIIIELQQKEIRRMQQENESLKRSKRSSRRPKPAKKSDDSQISQ